MKTLVLFILSISLMGQAQANRFTASVSKDGKSLQVKKGDISNKIPLKIPEGMEIEGKPKVFGDQNFGLVITELADFESATAIAYALGKDGKKIWSLDMKAFNPSKPLIEKEFVYLASIGKVWKLNRQSGEVVWSHEGLYKNESFKFNGDEAISRNRDSIFFSKNLKINDKTGKFEVAK